MDTSFTVKRDTVVRPAAGRGNVVRTDLSPSQSVNAAQPSAALHHTTVDTATREPIIGPHCQTLLDREREERMRRRRARNDEALLRQRAYGRAYDPSASEDDALPHADIQI